MRFYADDADPDIDYLPRRARLGRCSECWSYGGHAVGCPEETDTDIEPTEEDTLQ